MPARAPVRIFPDACIADQEAPWRAEVRIESRFAKDLVQLPATKKISPDAKDWKSRAKPGFRVCAYWSSDLVERS